MRGVGFGVLIVGVLVVLACLVMMRSSASSDPHPSLAVSRAKSPLPARAADGAQAEDTSRALVASNGPGPLVKEPVAPQVVIAPVPTETARKPFQVQQIRLTLAEDGDCRFIVDARDEDTPHEGPMGEPTTLAGVPNAVVHKSEAGIRRIVYSFAEVGSTADFGRLNGIIPSKPAGLSIDRTAGLLVLTPVSGVDKQGKKALLEFPRGLRAPLDVTVDFQELKRGTFILQANEQTSPGAFGVRLHLDPNDGSSIHAGVFQLPVVNGKRARELTLLDRKFPLGQLSESSFHLADSQDFARSRHSINLAFFGDESISIRRLEIRGKVPPSFGISMGFDKGGLKVKSAIKGGAAEKAGLKTGDILVSMDGEKLADLASTMSRLADAPIGQEVAFVVRRANQEKTIVVKGE